MRKSLVLCAAILAIHSGLAHGAEPVKPAVDEPPSVWMKKKLDYSEQIFAGLASGDFDKIAENAAAMRGLNTVELFVRGRTPAYRAQLLIFQEANEEIIRQAKKDNLEGVALGFNQLTLSCVNCHKQLRNEGATK